MDKDLVRNAADKKQVSAAKRKERSARENELTDIGHILSSFNGRRFMWRILKNCRVFSTSYVGGDPYATTFNEGSRNVGLELLGDIHEASPDAYMTMVKESKGDQYV